MSDVDLRLLRYLVAVVDEGSIPRAAKRLMIAQPTLSRAIRSLERTVGVDLLVRLPHTVEPTVAGKVLLDIARELDERIRDAVADARAAAQGGSRLRISARGLDTAIAAELAASFQDRFPDVCVDIVADDTGSPAESLRTGGCDLALLRDTFDNNGLGRLLLWIEPRVVLLSSKHPLAERTRLRLNDLHDEPITGPEVTSAADVLTAVRLGQAIAFRPTSLAPPNTMIPGVCIRHVDDLSPSSLYLAWHTTNVSREVVRFVRHAGEQAPPSFPAVTAAGSAHR